MKNPFAEIGIAPTLDMAEIKRAYFKALSTRAPQNNPEGFQLLRQAYERLSQPGGLSAAFLSSPVDVSRELVRYQERHAAIQEEAGAEASTHTNNTNLDRFSAILRGQGYEDAIRLFNST